MTGLPSFSLLQKHFPYKPITDASNHRGAAAPAGATVGTNKALIESIGGDLLKGLSAIYADLDNMNTCAVRLSYCLNRAGHTVSRAGSWKTFKGADGYSYLIRADEMIGYMKQAFGAPKRIFDGRKKSDKEWLGAVKAPTQGIFGYDWQGKWADFGAGGHVDIGRLPSDDVTKISDVGTASYFIDGAMIVFLWETAA